MSQLPRGTSHEGTHYNMGDFDEYLTYVQGTSTYDNMRQKNFPVYVIFTDRFNNKHKVTISDKTSEVTLWFPVGGKEINWHHPGGKDRTGFDAECTWGRIKFFYVASDFFNSNGLRIHFTGYKLKKASKYNVDWDSWEKYISMGQSASEAVKNLSEAYSNVKKKN